MRRKPLDAIFLFEVSMRLNVVAFTLVELLAVFSIIAIMAALAVPAALSASRKASVSAGVDGIVRVALRAQGLARAAPAPINPATAPHYGVGIFAENGRMYATVLFGTTAIPAAEFLADGAPVCRVSLGQTEVLTDHNGISGIGWFYQFVLGRPIRSTADQAPISIGTAAQTARAPVLAADGFQLTPALAFVPQSPVCQNLVIARRQGQFALALAIYSNGTVNTAPPVSGTMSTLFVCGN